MYQRIRFFVSMALAPLKYRHALVAFVACGALISVAATPNANAETGAKQVTA